MKRIHIFLFIICTIGTMYHMSFLHLNEVLKVADSFAYLQMTKFLQSLSIEWLWNWWFGFVYSLPIAGINIFTDNSFLAAKITNIILLNIWAFLVWKTVRKILSETFSLLAVGLFYLSPTFLHFNIHVLSENIYIPLFLWLFLLSYNFIEKLSLSPKENIKISTLTPYVVSIACLIWLMYLTRAEAFIYLGSIWIIAITLLLKWKLTLKYFTILWSIFIISFFIFISPYLWYLHMLTGEWGLTNKWASNLRQAELRGIEQMDDSGFEQAVAELTPDNTQLIAGFAWWMPYTQPQIEGSLVSFISKDPAWFLGRIAQNQKKLFSKNLPEIFLWKSPKLYYDSTQIVFFKNIFFLLFCIFPLTILWYGLYQIFRTQKIFFYSALAFFIPAMIFFTFFFTLNRYFLIFLPLMLIVYSAWLESLTKKIQGTFQYIILLFFLNILIVFGLSTKVYYSIESPKDDYYALKQEAWKWLKDETLRCSKWVPEDCNYISYKKNWNLKIMERFPVVTYYSWADYRYITPYTDNINNLREYALYNNIDILVTDTMDFQRYRPMLEKYLEVTPPGFIKLHEFISKKNNKVILYVLEK